MENGGNTQEQNFKPTSPTVLVGYPDTVNRKYDAEKKTNTFFVTLFAKKIGKGIPWEESPKGWYRVTFNDLKDPDAFFEFAKPLRISGYESKPGTDQSGFKFAWFNGRTAGQPVFGKKDLVETSIPEGSDIVWLSGTVLNGSCSFTDSSRQNMLLQINLLLEGPSGERVRACCEATVKSRINFTIGSLVTVNGYIEDGKIIGLGMERLVAIDNFSIERNRRSNGDVIPRLSLSDSPDIEELRDSLANVGDLEAFDGFDSQEALTDSADGAGSVTEDAPF